MLNSNSSLEHFDQFIVGSFQRQFIIDVHRMLYRGYRDCQKKVQSDMYEEYITGCIGDYIDELLKGNPDFMKQSKYYFLKEEDPVRGEPEKQGKYRQRKDLVFQFSIPTPRIEFVFEAKRLKSKTHPVTNYIGKEGLQCFVNNEYAKKYQFAGMLGYVQTDTLSYWMNDLKKKLPQNSSNFKKVSIIKELSEEFTTVHARTKNTDILIFHVLLDFS